MRWGGPGRGEEGQATEADRSRAEPHTGRQGKGKARQASAVPAGHRPCTYCPHASTDTHGNSTWEGERVSFRTSLNNNRQPVHFTWRCRCVVLYPTQCKVRRWCGGSQFIICRYICIASPKVKPTPSAGYHPVQSLSSTVRGRASQMQQLCPQSPSHVRTHEFYVASLRPGRHGIMHTYGTRLLLLLLLYTAAANTASTASRCKTSTNNNPAPPPPPPRGAPLSLPPSLSSRRSR